MKQILLPLFTAYQISSAIPPQTGVAAPPGQMRGAFGQFCPTPITGQVRCELPYDTAQPGTIEPGYLDCGRPNDCCMCSSITCGDATTPCNGAVFGRNAAFGVRDITVTGDAAIGGAGVECVGTTACANTLIQGFDVSELACAGEYACYGAQMAMYNPAPGFGIECTHAGACDGLQLEVYIPPPTGVCDPATSKDILFGAIECAVADSCSNLVVIINNQGCDRVLIESVMCPAGACNGAMFAFMGNVDIDMCVLPAAGIQPFGLEKCFTNLMELSCVGTECQNQVRQLIDPQNHFELLCEGPSACLNAQYTIDITAAVRTPATENMLIMCTAREACQNAIFVVNNMNRQAVSVGIECTFEGACDGTAFISGIGATFSHVLCEDPAFCPRCTYDGQPCATPPQTGAGPSVV